MTTFPNPTAELRQYIESAFQRRMNDAIINGQNDNYNHIKKVYNKCVKNGRGTTDTVLQLFFKGEYNPDLDIDRALIKPLPKIPVGRKQVKA